MQPLRAEHPLLFSFSSCAGVVAYGFVLLLVQNLMLPSSKFDGNLDRVHVLSLSLVQVESFFGGSDGTAAGVPE
jgi:hypothetical protein